MNTCPKCGTDKAYELIPATKYGPYVCRWCLPEDVRKRYDEVCVHFDDEKETLNDY